MYHGVALHASSLKVGDVVRPIGGGLVRLPSAPALFFPEDSDLPLEGRRRVTSTAGWRNPPVGGPDDFRQGYDAMTVYSVTPEYVSFARPFVWVDGNGTLGEPRLEYVNNIPRDGSHWYELLYNYQ